MIDKDIAIDLATECLLGISVIDNFTPDDLLTKAYLCGFREALRIVFSESEPNVFKLNIARLKKYVENWDQNFDELRMDSMMLLTIKQDLNPKVF